MGPERELTGQTCLDRIRGIVEDHHQRVTFRGDLNASVAVECLGQEIVVGFEQSDVLIASFPEEPSRALDVRHDERDDARRQSTLRLGGLHHDQGSPGPASAPLVERCRRSRMRSCHPLDRSCAANSCGAAAPASIVKVRIRIGRILTVSARSCLLVRD